MKLPPFRLHRPTTVVEACDLAHSLGFEASFLGGGTELVLLMKLGLSAPGHVIDLKSIDGLDEIALENGSIRIGALNTHVQIEQDPIVASHLPELARVSAIIANRRVRGTGTLAGNLCFADPHSDPATLLVALGSRLTIAGPNGSSREESVASFWLAPYMTSLAEGEMVSSIEIPLPSSGSRIRHERFKLKERPAVTVSAHLEVDGGSITSARIVSGSAEPRPRRLQAAERLLEDAGHAAIPGIAAAAESDSEPVSDQDGSADYKRHLVGVLATRAVERALTQERSSR